MPRRKAYSLYLQVGKPPNKHSLPPFPTGRKVTDEAPSLLYSQNGGSMTPPVRPVECVVRMQWTSGDTWFEASDMVDLEAGAFNLTLQVLLTAHS